MDKDLVPYDANRFLPFRRDADWRGFPTVPCIPYVPPDPSRELARVLEKQLAAAETLSRIHALNLVHLQQSAVCAAWLNNRYPGETAITVDTDGACEERGLFFRDGERLRMRLSVAIRHSRS